MTQSLALGSTTDGAGLSGGAGSIDPAVTQSSGNVGGVSVTTDGAGIGGVAVLGAGGLGDNSVVAVTQSLALGSTTDGAGLSGDAGSIDPGMAQGGNYVSIIAIAADATVNGVTVFSAGGSNDLTGCVTVDVVKGNDQHISIVVEGEVVDTACGNQLTIASLFKLPTDIGSSGSGIPNFTVITQPSAVFYKLKLVSTGSQLQADDIAVIRPCHIGTGPTIEGTVDADILGVAAGALAANIAVAGGRKHLSIGVSANCASVVIITIGGAGGELCIDIVNMLTGIDCVAQHQSIITVDFQGQRYTNTAGDKQLVCINACAGVIQCNTSGAGIPAIGHVPVLIVASLDKYIAIRDGSQGDLTVHKFVVAKVFVVIITS